MGMDNNESLYRPTPREARAAADRPTVYLAVQRVTYYGDTVIGVYDTFAGAEAHAHAAAAGSNPGLTDHSWRVERWRCGDLAGTAEVTFAVGGAEERRA